MCFCKHPWYEALRGQCRYSHRNELLWTPLFIYLVGTEDSNHQNFSFGKPTEYKTLSQYESNSSASINVCGRYPSLALNVSSAKKVNYWNSAASLVQCALKNASYKVDFDFNYPSQNVNVKELSFLNDVASFTSRASTSGSHQRWSAQIAYVSIMEAYGRLLVGTNVVSYPEYELASQTMYKITALGDILK